MQARLQLLSAEPQVPLKPQEPQQPPEQPKAPSYGDGLDAEIVNALVDAAVENINNGGRGVRAMENQSMMKATWPGEFSAATAKVKEMWKARRKAAGSSTKKRKYRGRDENPRAAGPRPKLV